MNSPPLEQLLLPATTTGARDILGSHEHPGIFAVSELAFGGGGPKSKGDAEGHS